ncbi:MAG: hypothetical protein ACR2HZ_10575 [Gemmatimonadaceae bacterium]
MSARTIRCQTKGRITCVKRFTRQRLPRSCWRSEPGWHPRVDHPGYRSSIRRARTIRRREVRSCWCTLSIMVRRPTSR